MYRLPLALAAAALLIVTGCGANSSSEQTTTTTVASAADHNDQDVMFAQMMIVHHQGAIAMADLAPTRASSAEVKDMAAKIEAAQAPEINTMTSWLTAWGKPVSGDQHSGHGTMAGMSENDMSALAAASGTAFDTRFLQLMIEHHAGAIDMAKTEQQSGRFAPAIELAGEIVNSQSAEVQQMQSLLASR